MEALSATALLRVWEVGLGQHPVERALTVLAAALPERSPDDLAALSVGRRDAHLLGVRALTFGEHLAGQADCPACGERLAFEVAAADLLTPGVDHPAPPPQPLAVGEYELAFRPPTSDDLRAIIPCGDVAAARWLLARRCVLRATRRGEDAAPEELPEGVVAALAAALAEHDAQADVQLALACPACAERWSPPFDAEAFLWAEIAAQAKRLLREVHTLARAYGWREAEILALSAARRQSYLELVGDG